MQRFSWPGNIRQLQNVVERAVLKAESQWVNVEQIEAVLDAEIIPDGASISGQDPVFARAAPAPARPYQWVRDADIESLQDALRQAAGNQTRAARLLGLTPRQFRYRLKKLQVES